MKKTRKDFNSKIENLYNKSVKTVTLQVTEDCNLCCTYCYQENKSKNKMTFETAKKFIDLLLLDKNEYINTSNSFGLIVDFIGGEPLLEIELVDKISDYILNEMIRLQHPWLLCTRFSFSSNGTLYFNPEFQKYLKKYKHWISYSITIDGNKKLHDSCRLFPDGKGSYDLALKASEHYHKYHSNDLGTKITISPYNIQYFSEAIIDFIEKSFDEINANCVFEEGWEAKHATILYEEIKKISDYVFENDLEDKIYLSILEEDACNPVDITINDNNWCGGNGQMLAVNHTGNLYPCLRYMESSLGKEVEPIIIGHIDHGIGTTDKEKKWIEDLQAMTCSSQSEEECLNCPIGSGCAWCSAYNYQYHKKLNKRATHICIMHKARALALVYFWNKYYKKTNQNKKMECRVPRDWALEIISEDEYNYLVELGKES